MSIKEVLLNLVAMLIFILALAWFDNANAQEQTVIIIDGEGGSTTIYCEEDTDGSTYCYE